MMRTYGGADVPFENRFAAWCSQVLIPACGGDADVATELMVRQDALKVGTDHNLEELEDAVACFSDVLTALNLPTEGGESYFFASKAARHILSEEVRGNFGGGFGSRGTNLWRAKLDGLVRDLGAWQFDASKNLKSPRGLRLVAGPAAHIRRDSSQCKGIIFYPTREAYQRGRESLNGLITTSAAERAVASMENGEPGI